MELRERLGAAVKDAMRAKEAERLSTLRMMSAAIKDHEIAARGEGRDVGMDDLLTLFGKMVKQRHESAKAFSAGGRPELHAKEMNEIKVISEFLPEPLGEAEVSAAIASAIAEVGASSIKDMGRVMAVLKGKYTGQMDFGAVGAQIKAQLG
ncbi:MAG: GatB/YqeY domain-containing protein [Cypionkella sp.]